MARSSTNKTRYQNVYVKPDLHKRLKQAALDLDLTIMDIVEAAIDEYLTALRNQIPDRTSRSTITQKDGTGSEISPLPYDPDLEEEVERVTQKRVEAARRVNKNFDPSDEMIQELRDTTRKQLIDEGWKSSK